MFYPLDMAGAGAIFMGLGLIVFLFLMWALVEGHVIFFFRINGFWRSVWQALVVNGVSMGLGLMGRGTFARNGELSTDAQHLPLWAALLLLTILVEGLVLWLMNRSRPAGRVFMASLVMNLATYLVLFAIIEAENA